MPSPTTSILGILRPANLQQLCQQVRTLRTIMTVGSIVLLDEWKVLDRESGLFILCGWLAITAAVRVVELLPTLMQDRWARGATR